MPFLQLTLDVAASESGAVESVCLDAGAISISLLDAADAPILEPAAGTTPLWPTVRLQALFGADVDRRAVAAALETKLGHVNAKWEAQWEAQWEEIADRVWEREWLKDFKPMRFGARLWVCPHGKYPPQEDATIVWLDPGLAFGTGTHATTAMCLSWLDATDLLGLDVTDYGCGSGILAIAAVRLGARFAAATDVDPQALSATRDNAARNGVAESIEVLSIMEPVPLSDVLLANILAEPLVKLAPLMRAVVRQRGAVVLSGILASQAGAVAGAFAPWFDMRPFATREGWVCLEGVRR